MRNDQDEDVLIATISRDITDFVEHEKAMRNEQRRTELIVSVARGFPLTDDFDATINESLSAIGGYMGIDSMFIYRDDREQRCFFRDYMSTSLEKRIMSQR